MMCSIGLMERILPMASPYCDAKSNDNYRITHKAVPGGRILVCAKCSAWFSWWAHQDYLPLHVAADLRQTKDEIIASFGKVQ